MRGLPELLFTVGSLFLTGHCDQYTAFAFCHANRIGRGPAEQEPNLAKIEHPFLTDIGSSSIVAAIAIRIRSEYRNLAIQPMRDPYIRPIEYNSKRSIPS